MFENTPSNKEVFYSEEAARTVEVMANTSIGQVRVEAYVSVDDEINWKTMSRLSTGSAEEQPTQEDIEVINTKIIEQFTEQIEAYEQNVADANATIAERGGDPDDEDEDTV